MRNVNMFRSPNPKITLKKCSFSRTRKLVAISALRCVFDAFWMPIDLRFASKYLPKSHLGSVLWHLGDVLGRLRDVLWRFGRDLKPSWAFRRPTLSARSPKRLLWTTDIKLWPPGTGSGGGLPPNALGSGNLFIRTAPRARERVK